MFVVLELIHYYYYLNIPVEGLGAQKLDLFPHIRQLPGETYFPLCWKMVDADFSLYEMRELNWSPAWRKTRVAEQYMKHCTY